MQLRGLLYRKVKQLLASRKRQERKIEKDIKISKDTQNDVNKLKSLMKRSIKKRERHVNLKFDEILENLHASNKLNKTIIKQNKILIGLLKKRRKISSSV